jgi:hypothetical protein
VPRNLIHQASPEFWLLYDLLPESIRMIAKRNFSLLKVDPTHPSLHFKRVRSLWSVRVGARYRALAMDAPGAENAIVWIWIGTHAEYDSLLKGKA